MHGGVDGVLGAGRSGQAHAVMRGDEFELEMYGEGMYTCTCRKRTCSVVVV